MECCRFPFSAFTISDCSGFCFFSNFFFSLALLDLCLCCLCFALLVALVFSSLVKEGLLWPLSAPFKFAIFLCPWLQFVFLLVLLAFMIGLWILIVALIISPYCCALLYRFIRDESKRDARQNLLQVGLFILLCPWLKTVSVCIFLLCL